MLINTLLPQFASILVGKIKTKKIIKRYKKRFDIDVSYLFNDLNEINILKCSKTGFRFYYPLSIEGDNDFYASLYRKNPQMFYQKTKWEFKEASSIIENNTKVLDVGCGGGNFFEELVGKNCLCYGIDKSDFANELLKGKGVEFSNMPIEDFSLINIEKFDYVTGFQILEHVKFPGKFISSMVRMVKKNGKLILAVPNNNPYFLKYAKYHTLNLPPHHMGLWNENSLQGIASHFGLKLIDIKYEGLGYLDLFLQKKINPKFYFLNKLIMKFLGCFEYILGKRTILVTYAKI
ncbi:MAG: class I SAM-dependent methyltransferase [Bacteroidota bacterium]|jgi:2-polyprenyl-3-methyl-5-hydroxy-6-metoxy-1,4-benzoquinol methylase